MSVNFDPHYKLTQQLQEALAFTETALSIFRETGSMPPSPQCLPIIFRQVGEYNIGTSYGAWLEAADVPYGFPRYAAMDWRFLNAAQREALSQGERITLTTVGRAELAESLQELSAEMYATLSTDTYRGK